MTTTEEAGTGVRWKGIYDIAGDQQVGTIVFGPSFTSTQPEVARRWMTGYLRGIRDYLDAFGPKKKDLDAVAQILAEQTRISPEVVKRMRPAGLDPDGKLLMQSLQDDLAYFEQTGSLQQHIDLSSAVDTSFQEYAAQQLGPYAA